MVVTGRAGAIAMAHWQCPLPHFHSPRATIDAGKIHVESNCQHNFKEMDGEPSGSTPSDQLRIQDGHNVLFRLPSGDVKSMKVSGNA